MEYMPETLEVNTSICIIVFLLLIMLMCLVWKYASCKHNYETKIESLEGRIICLNIKLRMKYTQIQILLKEVEEVEKELRIKDSNIEYLIDLDKKI